MKIESTPQYNKMNYYPQKSDMGTEKNCKNTYFISLISKFSTQHDYLYEIISEIENSPHAFSKSKLLINTKLKREFNAFGDQQYVNTHTNGWDLSTKKQNIPFGDIGQLSGLPKQNERHSPASQMLGTALSIQHFLFSSTNSSTPFHGEQETAPAQSAKLAAPQSPYREPPSVRPNPHENKALIGRGEAPTKFQTGKGHASAYAAHFLSSELGPVLLLRMPVIGASERQELEARLTELFESFGQRRPKVIVREAIEG